MNWKEIALMHVFLSHNCAMEMGPNDSLSELGSLKIQGRWMVPYIQHNCSLKISYALNSFLRIILKSKSSVDVGEEICSVFNDESFWTHNSLLRLKDMFLVKIYCENC